jgi:hypothetical protein
MNIDVRMNIDGRELPTLLRTFRPLLRDVRVDELQERAALVMVDG